MKYKDWDNSRISTAYSKYLDLMKRRRAEWQMEFVLPKREGEGQHET